MTDQTPYEAARAGYWRVQTAFRQLAIAEAIRLMPLHVDRIILDLNDTPRLTVVDFLDGDGESVWNADSETVLGWGDESLFDSIDQIASDMEVFSWDEGKSFLPRTDDGATFYIARHPQEAPQEARDSPGGTDDPSGTLPTPETGTGGRIPGLVHEARNILWSAANGGHNGRPSEVKRILEAICEEAEKVWGAS